RITAYLSRHDLSWRYALVIGVAPALLTLVVRLCVRESKRWEEARERGRTAGFADLFGPELRLHSLVGIALSAVAVLGMWGVYQAWLQAWVDTLVGPGDALKAARDAARAAVSTYMAVGSIGGALLGGWAAERLGRRPSYALFCVGATAVSMTLYLTTTAFDQRMLWLAALGGVFATAFFGWLPLYLPELFPTHLRSTGEGLTFNAGRILSAGGVLVTGRLVEAFHGHKYAGAAMACVWLLGLAAIWWAPETQGGELPE
ncbi:MAG: MFS transporter, partial [Armatimonadetes bacterium]|nr:MFS transporter [Armatimonadota bacterium]